MIDLTTGEDSLRTVDPDEIVLQDPEDSVIPMNEGVALVRTEEVWLYDKTTNEVTTQLNARSFMRYLPPEESDILIAKIMVEGIADKALSEYFSR